MRESSVADLTAVSPEQLCDFVLSISSGAVSDQAISALTTFYAFVTEKFSLSRDPAAGLYDRVHGRIERRAMERDLCRAGLDDDVSRGVRWRDVGVVGFLGGRSISDVGALRITDSSAIDRLFERLIASIRELPPEEVDDFLDSTVLAVAEN